MSDFGEELELHREYAVRLMSGVVQAFMTLEEAQTWMAERRASLYPHAFIMMRQVTDWEEFKPVLKAHERKLAEIPVTEEQARQFEIPKDDE